MSDKSLVTIGGDGSCLLHSPTQMPGASAFLWNRHMMIQMTCRGYATAQFMQPEPAKYAHAPNLEAKSFMQPEQPYYAHHPGRFCYLKDEESGLVASAPYEPVRAKADHYLFGVHEDRLYWETVYDHLRLTMECRLAADHALELWRICLHNGSDRKRKVSLVPYFPVGYMSWMNQSVCYRKDLQSVVCSSITPYQKVEDYFRNKDFKEQTFLAAGTAPDSWEANQQAFEGEGGLSRPNGLSLPLLAGGDARYEMPACILQYKRELEPGAELELDFIFGPARDDSEIAQLRSIYLSPGGFQQSKTAIKGHLAQGCGVLQIETPDHAFDDFVNHWLPRQVFYHGDVNRMTTDPQTRNYLQDNLGMCYIQPEKTRKALLFALAQQEHAGAMPDGILLHPQAQLKYINQVPHTDHCVWLPIVLEAYLDETDDIEILEQELPYGDSEEVETVFRHMDRAMNWLLRARDERGLSYIAQGDWCDPMNMVGYRGKGVSGWLTLATAYAFRIWSGICRRCDRSDAAALWSEHASSLNHLANRILWDGNWYARGITDEGNLFGIHTDPEGRIFLNPQAWALLSGAADAGRQQPLMEAVAHHLETPYGIQLLAPAFTAMREDIGRVTQKHPGSAENGSIYNHASAFYIYALFRKGCHNKGWDLLRRMLPGDGEDLIQRGQLPVFIPNYYRGAVDLFPRTAGRSSQLFNTGTAAWFYRIVIEGLFGLRGEGPGIHLLPAIPDSWPGARVKRRFRDALLDVTISRRDGLNQPETWVDDQLLVHPFLDKVQAGKTYMIRILLPETA